MSMDINQLRELAEKAGLIKEKELFLRCTCGWNGKCSQTNKKVNKSGGSYHCPQCKKELYGFVL